MGGRRHCAPQLSFWSAGGLCDRLPTLEFDLFVDMFFLVRPPPGPRPSVRFTFSVRDLHVLPACAVHFLHVLPGFPALLHASSYLHAVARAQQLQLQNAANAAIANAVAANSMASARK